MGPVNNDELTLYGLRYSLTAWRIGSEYDFHEDRSFFFWDGKKTSNALRHGSTGNFFYCRWNRRNRYEKFDLAADVGLETYGICSDKFLNEEFKNVRFEMKITIHNNDSFSYDQDSQLQIKGNPSLFHHTDKNTRSRVK